MIIARSVFTVSCPRSNSAFTWAVMPSAVPLTSTLQHPCERDPRRGVGGKGEGGGVVNEKWVSARREWGACGAHQLKVDDLPLLFDAKPKVEPRLS